jgi:hypothetical protein
MARIAKASNFVPLAQLFPTRQIVHSSIPMRLRGSCERPRRDISLAKGTSSLQAPSGGHSYLQWAGVRDTRLCARSSHGHPAG